MQIEGNAGNSLEVLAALDAVKVSMEKCSSILVEAEKLKKLSEDVDNVFKTNDFRRVRAHQSCRLFTKLALNPGQIADHILGMSQSLTILKDIPQFTDSQRQLMLFQDRLEGMARPHLLNAFNTHETSKCY